MQNRKLISCDCVYSTKYLGLWNLCYTSGKTNHNWTFASRKKEPNQIKRTADAVIVVVLHQAGLCVTKEFRPPLWDYEYGFPAGLLNDGEQPEVAAARELKEETGLSLTEIKLVTPPLFSSAGLSDEAVSLVYGIAEGNVCRDFLEDTEDIETFFMTRQQVDELCNSSKKISAKAWPILYNYAKTGALW
jgi:ADP-ribose pyrophosphatase